MVGYVNYHIITFKLVCEATKDRCATESYERHCDISPRPCQNELEKMQEVVIIISG